MIEEETLNPALTVIELDFFKLGNSFETTQNSSRLPCILPTCLQSVSVRPEASVCLRVC